MIPLSPIDHVFTGSGAYPIQFVFAYDHRLDAERLKASLAEVLAAFAPLRSQLQHVNLYSYGLQESDKGYTFNEDRLATEPDLENPAVLLELNDQVETLPGEPLMRVKLSHGPVRSYLAVSISHAVADGYSYFFFMSAWASQFRGEKFPIPDHRRELLIPAEDQLLKETVTPQFASDEAGFFWGEKRVGIKDQLFKWTVLPFTTARMKEILREASAGTDLALTENDALCAYLWRQLSEGATGDRFLSCPFDYRRIHPSLSPLYFGNAVRTTALKLSAAELQIQSLAETAVQVRRSVRSINLEAVQKSLVIYESLRRQHGLSAMEELHVVEPDRGLLITNLSRVPLQSLSFGGTPPYTARIATPTARTGAVLPTPTGIEVHLTT